MVGNHMVVVVDKVGVGKDMGMVGVDIVVDIDKACILLLVLCMGDKVLLCRWRGD